MSGPEIIRATAEEGRPGNCSEITRGPSTTKGVPVPITQEDEVPNATNNWNNDGAALDDEDVCVDVKRGHECHLL